MHELYRGIWGHVPPEKKVWKLDSRKRHILHSLDRTQLIHRCILLSFSQSLVIHDSRAEVQRFMIPEFLKQRFMILTCFELWFMIHDSWFRFHPRGCSFVPGTPTISCCRWPTHKEMHKKMTMMQHLIIKAQPPGRALFPSRVALALYPPRACLSRGLKNALTHSLLEILPKNVFWS